MSQSQITDYTIDPNVTSGTQLATILNRLNDSEITRHAGLARPPYAKAGTIWYDTSTLPAKLMLFDGTADHEIEVGVKAVGGAVPVGSILAFAQVAFGDNANGSPTSTRNTVGDINAEVNPDGFHVCDGSAPNDPDSPIWNDATKHVPNLTDSRFLMGGRSAGPIGGATSVKHRHAVDPPSGLSGAPSKSTTGNTTLVASTMPSHTHSPNGGAGRRFVVRQTKGTPSIQAGGRSYVWASYGGDSATSVAGNSRAHSHTLNSHTHYTNIPSFNSDYATIDNRPYFLRVVFIIRIK